VTLVVLTAGLAASALQRVRLASVGLQKKAETTHRESQSAVEWAAHIIGQDPQGLTWRDEASVTITRTQGTVSGVGQQVLRLTDPADNDLRGDPFDTLRLTVVTTIDPARHAYQLDFVPETQPLSCLRKAIAVTGTVGTPTNIYTAGEIWAGAADRYGDAAMMDVKDTLTRQDGLDALDIVPPSSTEVTFPPRSLFDDYVARGTLIGPPVGPISIDGVVLTPTLSPYGPPNSDGIYVIHAHGREVSIRRSRIVGTLVIINPGPGSRISGPVSISATQPGMPALLVNGSMRFELGTTDLIESSEGMNFNPPGAAFAGVEDSDTADRYTNAITGIVFLEGLTTISQTTTVFGNFLVEGSVLCDAQLRVTPVIPTQPSQGFWFVNKLRAQPGSYTRVR
jgi:hypothetical protein